MRVILALILVLGMACAAGQQRTAQPVPQEKRVVPVQAAEIVEARSFQDVKKAITGAQAYSVKGRTVFLSSGGGLAKRAEEELLRMFDDAFSAEAIGLSGLGHDDVLAQLDQRSVGSLVCLSSSSDSRLAVTVYKLESQRKSELLFNCEFKSEERHSTAFVMKVATRPDSVAAADSFKLFVSDGKKTVALDIDAKTERTVDTAVCEDQKLYNLGEGICLFCPAAFRGGKFTMEGDTYRFGGSSGFPLPEKASRFIKADRDEDGEMALLDKLDNVFGKFSLLTKTVSRQTTVFLALSPSGEIWGLRGDLIATTGDALEGPFASISSSDALACAMGEDGRLYEITIGEDFKLSLKEIVLDLPGTPVNMAVAGSRLCIFVPSENGMSLYSHETAR